MDKRLLSPDFLSNNLEYVQQLLQREGLKLTLVPDNSGTGVTYEVVELTTEEEALAIIAKREGKV